MRTDVKIGMVAALLLVAVSGGYFMFRGDGPSSIPIGDTAGNNDATHPASRPGRAGPTTSGAPSNKNGNGVSKDHMTASKPVAIPPSRLARLSDAHRPGSNPTTTPMASKPRDADSAPSVDRAGQPSVEAQKSSPNDSMPSSKPDAVSVPAPESDKSKVAGVDEPHHASLKPLTSSPAESGRSGPVLPAANDPKPTASLGGTPTALSALKSSDSPSSTASRDRDVLDLSKAATDTHRVQPGDTLSSLAQEYYGDTRYSTFLVESNRELTDPNVLRSGTIIRIPAIPADWTASLILNPTASDVGLSEPRGSSGKRYYTVRPGDSFYRIARTELGNASRWKELLALNNSLVHGDPTSLQPGQRLLLPES